ncbi:MAG TPA: hypothetical protein PLF21_07480 [Exilispira sp.]|nr:hypothetical protein [Exilispira sp.]
MVSGYNFHGALGTNYKKDRFNFTKVLEDVTDILAGTYHSLVLKKDGSLWVSGKQLLWSTWL